jgi:hypothetical protein
MSSNGWFERLFGGLRKPQEAAVTFQQAPGPPMTFAATITRRWQSHSILLRAGLVIVRAQHEGTGSFDLDLWNGGSQLYGRPEGLHLADLFSERGSFSDRVAVAVVPRDDEYDLWVEVHGGLPPEGLNYTATYRIAVKQPEGTEPPETDRHDFYGSGSDTTPFFELPAGPVTITAQYSATGRLAPDMRWNLYSLSGKKYFHDDACQPRVEVLRGLETPGEAVNIAEGEPHVISVKSHGDWQFHIHIGV